MSRLISNRIIPGIQSEILYGILNSISIEIGSETRNGVGL